MKTVRDTLREADPLRHEPDRLEQERDRLRQAVVGASGVITPSSRWAPSPIALVVTVALIVVGIMSLGSQLWPQEGATLQAQIRFEVRLAEDQPAPGLRGVRADGSDRVIYLHDEIIVTNDDIAQSRVVPGDGASRFSVAVEFDAAGTQKIRQATASHIGKPVAILIDGVVVMAPVVRAIIGASAKINGDFTRAEAERIVDGIGGR